MEGGAVSIFPVQLHAVDEDITHFCLIHVTHELGKINFLVFLPTTTLLNDLPQQEGGQPNNQPESYGFDCRIHQDTPKETGVRFTARSPEAPATKLDAVRTIWIRKIP